MKLKTNRGAAKRFKLTAKGKIKRQRAYHRHILSSKSPKRTRHLRKAPLVDSTNAKAIRKLLPYG